MDVDSKIVTDPDGDEWRDFWLEAMTSRPGRRP
jgi:hypothetical protein